MRCTMNEFHEVGPDDAFCPYCSAPVLSKDEPPPSLVPPITPAGPGFPEQGPASRRITVKALPKIVAYVRFVIDKTASMQPINDAVAENLVAAVEEAAKDDVDLRPGLIFVRDIPHDGPVIGLADKGWLSTSDFSSAVKGEPCIGNDTDAESQLDGIECAITGAWPSRPRAFLGPRSKHIVLTTNSGPHPVTQSGKKLDDVIAALKEARGRVHVIGTPDVEAYQRLTKETGGLFFDVNKELTKDRYADVLRTLGHTISKTAVA